MAEPCVEVEVRLVEAASPGAIRIGKLSLPTPSPAVPPATNSTHPRPVNMVPLPPVCADDDRPAICDLLALHAAPLAALRTAVAADELYRPALHDDLWLLRFWLSHKTASGGSNAGVAAAAKAARATLRYRHAHDLDGKDTRHEWPDEGSERPAYKGFFGCVAPACLMHCLPHPDRGIVSFVVLSGLDMHAMGKLKPEDSLRGHAAFTEWSYQMIDAISRRTGRLTKASRLIEMRGMRIGAIDRTYIQQDGANSKATEDYYPQLLSAVYICHPPSWIQVLWRLSRPFFPKRFVDKVDIISPSTNPNEAARLKRHLAPKDTPARFGGELQVWPVPLGKENVR